MLCFSTSTKSPLINSFFSPSPSLIRTFLRLRFFLELFSASYIPLIPNGFLFAPRPTSFSNPHSSIRVNNSNFGNPSQMVVFYLFLNSSQLILTHKS